MSISQNDDNRINSMSRVIFKNSQSREIANDRSIQKLNPNALSFVSNREATSANATNKEFTFHPRILVASTITSI